MLSSSTITTLRQQLVAGEITPQDIVLDLAKEIESRNTTLGAYLSWDIDAALAEAAKADTSGPLGGIPIAIKDNINVTGQPCTCGSRILSENYTAPYDAGAIQRLRAAGAIPFGRLNMDEFAMGSSTENSALGVTRNPRDLERVPGVQRRQRLGCGKRSRHRSPWFRHGRLDPPARRSLRLCGDQADLRTYFSLRLGRFRLLARSNRSSDQNRRRFRPASKPPLRS